MRFSPLLVASAATAVHGQIFDYLIAGAGTAGLVIANRLSALPNVTVAVIEPGPDVSNDSGVQSIDFSFTEFNKSINWQYESIVQPALDGRSLAYRAGRAIGGTSAVNGMIYIRGDKAQYDAWEELGNPGWNWSSVFSYHKDLEDFTIPTSKQIAQGATYDLDDHGQSGLLAVGFPYALSNSSFHRLARDTWQELGYEAIEDLNGGEPRGFAAAPQTLDRDKNVRESSARAYYEPVRGRRNLKIIRGTVQRITWGRKKGRDVVANGFEYLDQDGNVVTVGARMEVIISASAYISPLILESSGVGNPRILKSLGIPTVVNLPAVGESMQDHQAVITTYSLKTNISGSVPFSTMVTANDIFGDQTPSIAASTLLKLPLWAQQVSASSQGAVSAAAALFRFQIQHDLIFNRNVTIAELFPSNLGASLLAQYWTTMAFSWGSIHLSPAGGINNPRIDPRILTLDFDLEMLTHVGRLSQAAYSTAPLGNLFSDNISPGYQVLPLNATDAQWQTYLKSTVQNGLHVAGTCAMLPRSLGGVVDSTAKVYGTRNVRVVDASIMPMQVSGHTTGPLYGVAEKAAALILAARNDY